MSLGGILLLEAERNQKAKRLFMLNYNVKSYKHRIAYGAWLNDVRCEPLPLQDWPAPQLDDEAVNSLIKAMDVQYEAGYNAVDLWGLFSTWDWPPDIVSAVDSCRRRRICQIVDAAKERGLKLILGFGNYSWGYRKITAANPSLMGRDHDGRMLDNVLCDANPESFEYVKRMLDFALSEFEFQGVHLESCDLGCCECPECAGKYGSVGYNARINKKTADYIRSRWPDKAIYVITIGWLRGAVSSPNRKNSTPEEREEIADLSRHVDCIVDHGPDFHIAEPDRRDFIARLHCDYGTSTGIWVYHDVRTERGSYFLPYPRRMGEAIKFGYEEGVRGCLVYQGPVNNAGAEATMAVGGRMLADASRSPDEALAEVLDFYYKPKSAHAHRLLISIFHRAEDSYFDGKSAEVLVSPLFGTQPGPASYLLDPLLDSSGRALYRRALVSILQDLPILEGCCDDGGRMRNIAVSVSTTLRLLNTISCSLGESL